MKNSIKAAIIYLANSAPKYVNDLKISLSSLDVNFNDQFKYPVIIFHRDFSEELIQDIRKATHSDIRFERIEFKIPDFLNKAEIPERYLGFDIEYRHMCRFFSGPVYWHPVLKDYDWYWRLDTDSFLLGKIDYDVFQFMQKHNYMYGYIIMLKDRPETTKNLWNLTEKYIRENKIQPTFLYKFTPNGIWNRYYYYTNFEIGKLDFWRSEKFRKYFDYLDRSGGIYKYRWGDTAIRSLAIYMFMPEKQVYQFGNIGYKHQGFINKPSKFKLLTLIRRKLFYIRTLLGSKPVLVKYYLKLKKLLESFCK